MVALLKDYPLKATTDARSAMAEGLAREVSKIRATLPKSGREFGFRIIYDTWARFEQRAVSSDGLLPAAAILPDRPVYEDSSLTPRMIEETWSGGDPLELKEDGSVRYPLGTGAGDGFALYTIAEMVVPFVFVFRAQTSSQRKAFVKRLEEFFVEDGALLPEPSTLSKDVPVPDAQFQPVRYGRRIELGNYYKRKARFTLQAQQLLDSESSARENRWMAQFELTGHVQVCVLRRVRAMSPRVQTVVNGTTDSRAV